MSEPIPESIPTSISRPSQRASKKLRTVPASTNPLASSHSAAVSNQAAAITSLMADPDTPVAIPPRSTTLTKPAYNPPEIVANVQGSSAGAGSGEFHVYKASRRRENERIRVMEEETRKEVADAEWERERREKAERDERGREKKRAKRARKNRKGGNKGPGLDADQKENVGVEAKGGSQKENKRAPLMLQGKPRDGNDSEGDGEEANTNGSKENEAWSTNGAQDEIGVVIHDDDV